MNELEMWIKNMYKWLRKELQIVILLRKSKEHLRMMRIWLSSEEMPVILLGNLEIKSRNVSLERMEN